MRYRVRKRDGRWQILRPANTYGARWPIWSASTLPLAHALATDWARRAEVRRVMRETGERLRGFIDA